MALRLEIFSPDAMVYSAECIQSITLPTLEGEIEILSDHRPILTILKRGEVHVVTSGNKAIFIIHDGFAQVINNHISVLTSFATAAKK